MTVYYFICIYYLHNYNLLLFKSFVISNLKKNLQRYFTLKILRFRFLFLFYYFIVLYIPKLELW